MKYSKLLLIFISIILVNELYAAEKSAKPVINEQSIVRIDVNENDDKDSEDFDKYMKKHGKDYRSHYAANKQLRNRVRRLELAVMQLQDVIFYQQSSHYGDSGSHFPDEKIYSCLLETHHRGSYLGNGRTRIEAKWEAQKSCENKNGEFWCKGKVTCESN